MVSPLTVLKEGTTTRARRRNFAGEEGNECVRDRERERERYSANERTDRKNERGGRTKGRKERVRYTVELQEGSNSDTLYRATGI